MMVVERQDGAPADRHARHDRPGVGPPAHIGRRRDAARDNHRELPVRARSRRRSASDLIRGGAFVPLVGRELRPVGTLSLFWRADHEPGPKEIDEAEKLAASCIPAIENARRYGEARKLAETDALTGLYNQRYFQETLRREVTRAHRYQRKLTLIVFDLDDFKSINDQVGHLAGDRVLAQAADRLREAVRSVDVACRIGGDEFAVIMAESAARTASSSSGVSTTPCVAPRSVPTSSGSVSRVASPSCSGDTPASLFERADAALYRAKELGKDRADIAGAGELRPDPSSYE